MSVKETINTIFAKLPFKMLAEKIPAGARAKVPLLDKVIPFANQIVCGLAVVLVVVIIIAASGGSGPKALAKQAYNLSQQALKAGIDLENSAALARKSLAIQQKVIKLSASNQLVYAEELARLMAGEGSGKSSGGGSGGETKKYKLVTAYKTEHFVYDLIADKTGVVIKNMNEPSNGDYYNVILIPPIIEGYPVVEIQGLNWWWTSGCSITFPDTVTTLGEKLFENAGMKTVRLPSKITVIPAGLFWFSKITEITIPDGVTEIGEFAFNNCQNLTTITIPNGVTKIGRRAFLNCDNLTTVIIPNSVIEIGEGAFFDCNNLTTVNLPPSHSIQYVRNNAFEGCSKLTIAMRETIRGSGYTGEF